jgi:hypothetical protein
MKHNPINHILARSTSLFFIAALLVAPVSIAPAQTVHAAAPTPVVDQSFTSPTNASTAINDCCRYVAQTFTAGLTGDLAAVSLDVLSTGPFALHIAIHGVTNGLPNSTILGERTLWTSSIEPISSAPLSLVIDFGEPIYVIAGHQYAIVVDYEGSGSPGTALGDWSGATGNGYPAGAAYDTNDESFSAWTPVGTTGIDLHFKTYVITNVSVSDLAIRLVWAPKYARACQVFRQVYWVRNLGPNTAKNVIVTVGGTDQFDTISVQGVPGSQSSGRRLGPGKGMFVTAVIKVTAFVPGEVSDGRVGATVSSEVYPQIAIDPNLNNNVRENIVRLIGRQRISCP